MAAHVSSEMEDLCEFCFWPNLTWKCSCSCTHEREDKNEWCLVFLKVWDVIVSNEGVSTLLCPKQLWTCFLYVWCFIILTQLQFLPLKVNLRIWKYSVWTLVLRGERFISDKVLYKKYNWTIDVWGLRGLGLQGASVIGYLFFQCTASATMPGFKSSCIHLCLVKSR